MSSVWVRHRRALAVISFVTSLAIALATPAEAARRKSKAKGYSPPYASIVVDAKTGKVLQGTNIDAPRIPASLTKVMSLYLLFEQLEQGRMKLNTPLTVSAYAAGQAPTKLGLKPGSTIEVEDAIKAMVVLSANDVSVVVAENIAGSEDAFAQMMTRKARELGMKSSTFYNPHGLPHTPPNISTARDLSILGRAIQDRFPQYFAYFSTRSFQYGSRTIRGHNRLLGKVEGVDGIKTGYTRLSGFNLLTSVNTPSRNVVAVVLGGRSGASRDRQMAALIDQHLPRAYAGARTAPPVVERAAQPTAVAALPPARPETINDETTAAAAAPVVATSTPQAAPARKPLDLNALRPVVASAAGASSTTTPSSVPSIRWQKGPEGLPRNADAFAALPAQAAPAPIPADQRAALQAKFEDRVAPAPLPPAKVASVEPMVPAATETPQRPAVTGWVVQISATDDEAKAKAMLEDAQSRAGRILAKASPFTEKVTKDGTTLYRARFSGFDEAAEAKQACKALKKSGFSCFAARS